LAQQSAGQQIIAVFLVCKREIEKMFNGVWIPKDVWLSKNLTWEEKIFLVEIDSLDGDKGCRAGDAYFAEFFDISGERCREIIKSLEKKELISISYDSDDKRTIRVKFNDLGGERNGRK